MMSPYLFMIFVCLCPLCGFMIGIEKKILLVRCSIMNMDVDAFMLSVFFVYLYSLGRFELFFFCRGREWVVFC